MYRRVLLAYDGSVEGRAALREGALLAKTCGAEVFLLSAVGGGSGMRMAEGTHAGAVALQMERFKAVLEEGVDRLKAIGFSPVARLVVGDATDAISQFAKEIKADLVVVGTHRRPVDGPARLQPAGRPQHHQRRGLRGQVTKSRASLGSKIQYLSPPKLIINLRREDFYPFRAIGIDLKVCLLI